MRNGDRGMPIWPYIGVVACLFVLTVLATGTWKSLSTSPEQDAALARARANAEEAPRGSVAIEYTLSGISSVWTKTMEGEASMPCRLAHRPSATELVDFEAPQQFVPLAPPVADRVEVEPASPESAALPSESSGPTIEVPIMPPPQRSAVLVPLEPPVAAPLPRTQVLSLPDVASCWPYPATLVTQLEALAARQRTRGWAEPALHAVARISRLDSLAAPEMPAELARLKAAAQSARPLADQVDDPDLRIEILRAAYAIERRMVVWEQVHRIASTSRAAGAAPVTSTGPEIIESVCQSLASNSHAAQWRSYLLLDELCQLGDSQDTTAQRRLARRVLSRMKSPQLTEEQAAIFTRPPFTSLEQKLRRWANEPVDYLRLLDDIEAFETSRSTADAQTLADSYQRIRWCAGEELHELAETLNTHYRNANVRVAIKDELLNRLLPPQDAFDEEVDESIAGARVLGNARTSARLQARLVPDHSRWRVGLELEGEIESETAATRGPATFYNEAHSRYLARKLLLVDRRGVRVLRAEAAAESQAELTGLRTAFDDLPIIGWLVRAIATQQHDDQYGNARRQTEARLEDRTQSRFDEEVHRRLTQAETDFERKMLAPLKKLELDPSALDMHTTDDRLVARYRLASASQLGAFTPRPQAPSDSLLSVQIHETMLNNTLAQLGLEGKRSDLRDLYRELAATFERTDLEVPDDIPEDVTIQFADENAVRLHVDEGRVMVTLRIAELKNRRRSWNDFSVRAFYVPDPTQLHANLVREDAIQLIGDRLTTGDQISLRFIFTKVLAKSRPVNIVNAKIAENPELADLAVNQFVIVDGWIGVALGPDREGAGHVAGRQGTSAAR